MSLSLDFIVIIVFSAFVLGIGFLFSKTSTNIKSFFAGGESVPWMISGISLFMSFFSAGTFVAWGSVAYQYGWVSITIQWTMAIGALVTALFIAPMWKRTGNLTAAEYIQQRLGIRVQKLYVYIFMVVSLFLTGAVLYPVAKLVSSSLDLPLLETTIVLGLVVIAYTAAGGLWAIMVTDVLQFVILTAAVLIVIPLAFDKVGGVSGFMDKAPDDFFQVLNGEYTFWFVIAFIVYHIFYIGGNWTFVQRYTSVESPKAAGKVAYLFAALYLISPVIWMLPPMVYRLIDPSLQGLDTENAYLLICKLLLPSGLMGLMLTGMYFATASSANTTLNVAAAVFTNDIYKRVIKSEASEKQLMKIARLSSWVFGILMIVIALLVPYMGGMVEVVLSVAAVTAGPLLAPPIWALFSKRLSGRATIWITLSTLFINIIFKIIMPFVNGFRLDRAEEMVVGIGVPTLLLLINELLQKSRMAKSEDYDNYIALKEIRDARARETKMDPMEVLHIKRQNHFGLKVITFSLLLTAVLLFALSGLASSGKGITAWIGVGIIVVSIIPWIASRKVGKDIQTLKLNTLGNNK